jgi:glycosyltransferase involved in cell wall biosynthesis
MSQPRVSVIITSYNQERYLKEAIESVVQQSFKTYEVIIADDHSTKDNSVGVIRDYIARYPGWVHGIFHDENIGIPKNRNSALKMVTGDYVAVLDGDDRLLPNFIERHLKALAENSDAGCSYGNRYQMDTMGQRIRVRNVTGEPFGDVFAYTAAGRMGILRSLMARYDLVRAAGYFDENFIHHDGFILSLRLAKLTKFTYVPEPVMEKRTHLGGFSKTISRQERIRCFEDVLAEIRKLSTHLPRSEAQAIDEIWFRRILKLRLAEDLAEGRKLEAVWALARNFAWSTRRVRSLWNLARQLCQGTVL